MLKTFKILAFKSDCTMSLVKLMKLKKNREGTFKHGVKCVCYVLGTAGELDSAKGIELIECKRIVDLDCRECLINHKLETCFEEKFNKEEESDQRLLIPNKKNDRKVFVEKYEELLRALPIENESNHTERSTDEEKTIRT